MRFAVPAISSHISCPEFLDATLSVSSSSIANVVCNDGSCPAGVSGTVGSGDLLCGTSSLARNSTPASTNPRGEAGTVSASANAENLFLPDSDPVSVLGITSRPMMGRTNGSSSDDAMLDQTGTFTFTARPTVGCLPNAGAS